MLCCLYPKHCVLQATSSTVFTVFLLINLLPTLSKPHTSSSIFRRETSVSLNYWYRGTLKVTLRLPRHIGSLTQLSYVSIIVVLSVLHQIFSKILPNTVNIPLRASVSRLPLILFFSLFSYSMALEHLSLTVPQLNLSSHYFFFSFTIKMSMEVFCNLSSDHLLY